MENIFWVKHYIIYYRIYYIPLKISFGTPPMGMRIYTAEDFVNLKDRGFLVRGHSDSHKWCKALALYPLRVVSPLLRLCKRMRNHFWKWDKLRSLCELLHHLRWFHNPSNDSARGSIIYSNNSAGGSIVLPDK